VTLSPVSVRVDVLVAVVEVVPVSVWFVTVSVSVLVAVANVVLV